MTKLTSLFLVLTITATCLYGQKEPYLYNENSEPRWSSFENPEGDKGKAAKENRGAKGHAFDQLKAGQTVVLMEAGGSGVVNRMWFTISDRSQEMLRSLKLEMYWDGQEKPAVSVPFGDFFCMPHGLTTSFENHFFVNAEGRSFVCYIPMPYRDGARITLTNESGKDLSHLFYDINYQELDGLPPEAMYFHCYWSRNQATAVGGDFRILPRIEGYGRFIGCNVGVISNLDEYGKTWWGEGEVKIYLDGDKRYPTLAGTGTEDYIGTAWGQGVYANRYQGSIYVNHDKGLYSFYRLHEPDPIYFHDDIMVAIQQIGGGAKDKVAKLVTEGKNLIPITRDKDGQLQKFLEADEEVDITAEDYPDGWVNFYRSDDVCATAYFYLDKPISELPFLQPVGYRTENIPVPDENENNQ